MSLDDDITVEDAGVGDACYSHEVLPFRVTDEVHDAHEASFPLGRFD